MKNPIVVKDNILINASYNLDLVEQRLVLLAIIEARESKTVINAESELTIHASSYINHFNVEKQTAYEMLKQACEALFHRQFSYRFNNKFQNPEQVRSRWVSKISYVDKEALVRVTFAPDVIPLITRLEERFTSYELEQVANLTSRYSLRLYELLIAWRSTGKTPELPISEFRQQLGVDENLYNRTEAFKRRVLNSAIEQINEHTDITVKYEQHKSGKTITGFSFSFKQKKVEKSSAKSVSLKKLTTKQISLFANKLAYDQVFASNYSHVGETYEEFAVRLESELTNSKKIKLYQPYLEKVGFEP